MSLCRGARSRKQRWRVAFGVGFLHRDDDQADGQCKNGPFPPCEAPQPPAAWAAAAAAALHACMRAGSVALCLARAAMLYGCGFSICEREAAAAAAHIWARARQAHHASARRFPAPPRMRRARMNARSARGLVSPLRCSALLFLLLHDPGFPHFQSLLFVRPSSHNPHTQLVLQKTGTAQRASSHARWSSSE